ncbi:hypothetical protein GOARA_019_00420 [Gordonia araii NBRC 100433]|uniref:AbiEi antitoxin N-terminal domain-containing protein n=1 Tax=Gordonia araii NBRC 100433 TaxID=1073574 RepID=G7GYT5_9ACTN|nr:hypothetical protein [Gordonia araii]NNG98939.1 hypothetical protein [Gordonia araii NBRC 100433]GAB08760.1 hypothetical protein GOARA_019_00420 [Gordonia araii NBRC 100433]
MTTLPIDADGAVRRSTVVAKGINAATLYRAVREGELCRIGSGLYVPSGGLAPDLRHRLMLSDVSTSPEVVVSHTSAAVLHGLPMLKPDLRAVHLTVPTASARVDAEFRRIHVDLLSPAEVVEREGFCTTSLERTAVDVALTSPMGFAGALAVFDAALRRGAKPRLLAELLRRRRRAVPVVMAWRHASPNADGVGESWCRAQLVAAGLPRPRLKHPLIGLRDEVLAEPDMNWGGVLLGEFDGANRYERIRVKGDSRLGAAWRAISRDDRLQRRGIHVLRWTWANLERHDLAMGCRPWLRRLGQLG